MFAPLIIPDPKADHTPDARKPWRSLANAESVKNQVSAVRPAPRELLVRWIKARFPECDTLLKASMLLDFTLAQHADTVHEYWDGEQERPIVDLI